MYEQTPRGGIPRTAGVEVLLVSAPRSGELIVRFLAPFSGCMTHYQKPNSYACPGALGQCDPKRHKGGSVWKAYAPCEWFRDGETPAWIPAVFEITERFFQLLGSENPRGQIWKVWRRPFRGKAVEVTGVLLQTVDPSTLRLDVRFEAVVQRALKSPVIEWGVPCPSEAPQVLEPVEATRMTRKTDAEPSPSLPLNPKTGLPFTMREMYERDNRVNGANVPLPNGRH